MQKHSSIILSLLLIFFISASVTSGQKVEKIRVADLDRILKNTDNNLYVINFWATWCAPCVAELPAFMTVSREYEKSGVKFVFVSLDFPSRIDKQLIPFLQKNKIEHEIAVMMETDANLWIDKVDPSWEGNIPSTLFLNNQKKIRHFYPEPIDEKDLRKLINTYM
jgi:thiol-disulfide isomerase/thioredoxin